MAATILATDPISTAELEAVLPPAPQYRRPARIGELALLLLALAAGIGGLAMVGVVVDGALSDQFWFETGALAGLSLAVHVILRIRAPFADQTILPAAVLLNGVGLAMIQRLQLSGFAPGADAARNTQWTLLAVALACITLFVLRDHRVLRKLTYTAMLGGIIMLLLPLVPGIGVTINGATSWVHFGPFSLQPSEFSKILFAIFFAGYLVTNRDTLALAGPKFLKLQLPRARDLGPILVVWAMSIAVLVFQNDLGTSMLVFALFVAMLYLATQRFSWILIGMVLFGAGGAVVVRSFWHVGARFDIWLNAMDPEVIDRVGGSWQLLAGMFGMANGGLLGTGWGRGHPYLVPLSFSDFIYTALGEELGLTGLVAILLVYLVLIERGFRTAILLRDGFGKLLAGGLSFLLAIQLFVVVGGVTRLMPLSGFTLPFVAQGGSSLLSSWLIIALLLRMSDNARRPSIDPGIAPTAVARPEANVVIPGRSFDDVLVSGTPAFDTGDPATQVVAWEAIS